VDDISPEQIREFRVKKNLSQEQLASMLGVSVSTIIRWEQGSSSPTGTASAVLAAITSGAVGHSILGLGPLGVSAFGIYRALKEAFEDGEIKGSSPILVARCENAADSISFWDERINH